MEKKVRNVITQKEYNELFKAMSNLYGVINSDEIHYLLNQYFNKVTKREIITQLKKILEKPKRDYFVGKIINMPNKYYLINDFLSEEEINDVIDARGGKTLYVPNTKEDLLKYVDKDHMTEKENDYYGQLIKYLSKRNNSKNKEAYATSYVMYLHSKNRVDSKITNKNPFDLFEKMGFFVKDKNDAQKFLDLYMKCTNNTKMYQNKGWTPQEMIKMTPKVDVNEITLGIGDGMKKMFRDQNFDVENALNQARNSDLPKGIKESLINEFELILNERKNKA